jgi:hypothetical protein
MSYEPARRIRTPVLRDAQKTAMSAELQAQFDALRIHVRCRLIEEARKIAQNNNADYNETLEAHFKFYLSTLAQ